MDGVKNIKIQMKKKDGREKEKAEKYNPETRGKLKKC